MSELADELATHEPCAWMQVGPCVYCTDHQIRLYGRESCSDRSGTVPCCARGSRLGSGDWHGVYGQCRTVAAIWSGTRPADHDGPAIAAITRVLARAHDDGADDEVTARHILTALTGHGWRLTNAQPAPAGGPVSPPTDEFLAARAAIQPPT